MSGIISTFTDAMVTKRSFWSKFGTYDREMNIEHKQIPKKGTLIHDENYHDTQHVKSVFFLYLAVLIFYS